MARCTSQVLLPLAATRFWYTCSMLKGTNRSPKVWMETTGILNSPLALGIQRRPSVRRRLASAAAVNFCADALSAVEPATSPSMV